MGGQSGWERRDVLAAAAMLALAAGIPIGVAALSADNEAEAPTDRQRTMMRSVAQAVLPRTDTPGAGDVGVGDFVILALAHGLDGTRDPAATAALPYAFPQVRRPDGSLRYLDWLERSLDRRAGGDWVSRTPDQQARSLAALDADAFADRPESAPWKKIKGLILTGYYTSEVGASRELQFNLVPGRYDPAVPLHPHDRAFSSDWTAVDFG